MWMIILCSLFVLWVYTKVRKYYKYWEEKGVPYSKPFLIFGNLTSTIFRRRPFAFVLQDLYNAHPNARYFGVYQIFQPTLVVRDPEVIKQITVKDFDVFPDHKSFRAGEADVFFKRNLASLKNEDGWGEMRATVSPFFTSSKLRAMFILMQACSKQLVDHFKAKNTNGTVTVELKDAFSRFTNDVIATTAFGVTCNSLKDRDNEFYLMGKDATNFTGLRMLKMFAYTVAPTIAQLLKVKLLSDKVTDFFKRIVAETLQIREEKGIIRPDLIYLLMETRKGNFTLTPGIQRKPKVKLTDDDITAQALVFFLAGFDTASTVMSYICYELALNTDIQNNLHREVTKVVQGAEGTITYEALLELKYLDNIVSETLRRHAPLVTTDRNSVKPCVILPQEPGGKPLYLEENTAIWVPIRCLHMDPDYFPDPEKFDPDRFNDKNKHKIKPFTYFPFGLGPRNCIASRFGLLEVKLVIAELIRCFEMVPVKETEFPLKLSCSNLNPMPDNGIWLGLKRR